MRIADRRGMNGALSLTSEFAASSSPNPLL